MLPTEAELARRARRRSWWLLVARLSSGRTQADAAAAVGLVGSSYGDFERGVTEPSIKQLMLLAVFYDVPLAWLTDPPPTDEERLEEATGNPSRRTAANETSAQPRRRATG